MIRYPKFLVSLVVVLLAAVILSACTPSLGPQKSGLQVITTDVPASIFLNGQYLEKTPYIGKNLQPGEYLLKIQPDDPKYVPYEATISLKKGLLSVVTWKPGTRPETSGGVIYEMEKLASKKKTEVSFVSIPDKAIVSFDQEKKDFTPLLLEDVAPGTHQLEITLPSYDSQKHTINVIEGYRINITIKLAKQSLETANKALTQLESTASAQNTTTDFSDASQAATPIRKTKTSLSDNQASLTINSTNFYQDGEEVLRVRDKASSTGKQLGFALVGESYPYLGETVSGWYKIEFENQEAWVSSKYASLDK